MAKKKTKNQAHQPKRTVTPAPAEKAATPVQAETIAKKGVPFALYLVPLFIVLALAGGAVWYLNRPSAGAPAGVPSSQNGTAETTPQTMPTRTTQIGRTTACQKNPAFIEPILGKQVVASTASGRKGLVMFNPQAPKNVYQHPSWTSAGYLGQFVVDQNGNTYVTPAIEVSVPDSATLNHQDTIFKVDTQTGVMSPFIEITGAGKPSKENVFGAMGLAYDCDTNSLYVATVTGSTANDEIGGIYRIDLNTNVIVDQLKNTDVLGIGVWKGVFGRRLYFAKARVPEVYSIGLDAAGKFVGEPRFEFALNEFQGGRDDKGRRIQFTDKREMTVRGWPFDYNLIAQSEFPKRNYKFKYNEQNDVWDFEKVEQAN